jgi:FtsZ-interacting cell division protein ZipA
MRQEEMMKQFYLAIAIILLCGWTSNVEAGQVYTWTDADGNLHITNSPPPKNATIKEVTPYTEKTREDIRQDQRLQEQEAIEDLQEKQEQQIEEAKREARQADQAAKQAVGRANKITQDNNAYIRRLGSTKEKRKQFRKKIQRLKQEAEAAQAQANAAIAEARQAAEAVQKLEEETAQANQQPQNQE